MSTGTNTITDSNTDLVNIKRVYKDCLKRVKDLCNLNFNINQLATNLFDLIFEDLVTEFQIMFIDRENPRQINADIRLSIETISMRTGNSPVEGDILFSDDTIRKLQKNSRISFSFKFNKNFEALSEEDKAIRIEMLGEGWSKQHLISENISSTGKKDVDGDWNIYSLAVEKRI